MVQLAFNLSKKYHYFKMLEWLFGYNSALTMEEKFAIQFGTKPFVFECQKVKKK